MNLFGVSIGVGNGKVGDAYTFSLPSHVTCPGASPWCLKYCYAHRYERRRPICRRAYQKNLALAKQHGEFVRIMTGVLPRILPCMRIHVAGDFFGSEYIKAWKRICSAFPQTRFWAYTRSWAVPHLLPALETLRACPNVELLASTDSTMPLPPKGWRVAFVQSDPRASGLSCKEQSQQEASCLACGYCFRQSTGNVVFRDH